MTGPTPVRPRVLATTALFVVSDLQRSIDFYTQKIAFRDASTWGEPPCFAMMHRDGFDLMLSLSSNSSAARPNGPSGVWDLYVRVSDVGAEAAALTAAGVAIAKGPTRTEYQMHEIEIVDPDGYRTCFGQDLS